MELGQKPLFMRSQERPTMAPILRLELFWTRRVPSMEQPFTEAVGLAGRGAPKTFMGAARFTRSHPPAEPGQRLCCIASSRDTALGCFQVANFFSTITTTCWE